MTARMIDRRLAPVIERRIAEVPAVVLLGARQTGKTTLALTVRSNLADAIVLILADRQFDGYRHAPWKLWPLLTARP